MTNTTLWPGKALVIDFDKFMGPDSIIGPGYSFKPLVATIFAERLLLMMQTVTTPATHAVVTSLVFEKDVAMVSAEDKTFEEKGKSAEYSSSNDSPISRNVELQTSRPTREEVRREGSYV